MGKNGSFMRKIFQYLRYVFGLLKLNFGTMLVFEVLYKFAVAAVFKPVLKGVLKLALRAQGLDFLSDETIGIFLKAPVTWVFLAVIVVGVTFFCLFDICCIIICIHASYHHQQIPLLTLMQRGWRNTLRVLYPKNLLMILYLLIIIPMTHAILISGYMTQFAIPDFIMEYIFSHVWLAILYVGFWVYMGLRSFHWIYSLHYFCLEKCDFKQARRKSWRLQGKNYWWDMIAAVAWNGALIAVYYGIIMFGAWLVSRVNQALSANDVFSSLTLSGISLLLNIMGALIYCFGLPLFFLCVSLLFYYHKTKRGEQISPPLEHLEEAYRLTRTAWAKKLYQVRKRIIAVCILAVLGVNFVYNIADKKGFLDMGLKHSVEVTAHRGYSAEYPENTTVAFRGAIEINADWIELDVQETADGEVIVMHDSNLKRTTGVDKEIWEVTWDEIKDLDNGSWFDPMYREIRIPTLAQVLKLAHGKIKLNIEIKPTGHEKHLEESVAALLEEYHMMDSCIVSSMKYDPLEKVKKANPQIQTAYITSVSYGNFTELEYADGYSVESMMLTQRFVNQAHRAGKEVYVWTVNSEERLEEVISMGVDNVVTDDPVMAETLIYEKEHSTFWDVYIRKLLKLSN